MKKEPKSTTGKLTQQEAESFVKEASASDPIYTRGYAIGVKRLPTLQERNFEPRRLRPEDLIGMDDFVVGETRSIPLRPAGQEVAKDAVVTQPSPQPVKKIKPK